MHCLADKLTEIMKSPDKKARRHSMKTKHIIHCIIIFTGLIFLGAAPVCAKKNKHQEAPPPGLQKKIEQERQLPKGWEKSLIKGKVITPEIYHMGVPVAPKAYPHLPPAPQGSKYLMVGGRIVHILETTGEIINILQ